jgi:hypothetical protein
MAHIPVRHPFGAAFGCANRQSCRFVLARLAALVPLPGVHLVRYHGVFAPASALRSAVFSLALLADTSNRGRALLRACESGRRHFSSER